MVRAWALLNQIRTDTMPMLWCPGFINWTMR